MVMKVIVFISMLAMPVMSMNEDNEVDNKLCYQTMIHNVGDDDNDGGADECG